MEATFIDKQGNICVVDESEGNSPFSDEHTRAEYKKQEHQLLFKEQAPSTVKKIIRSRYNIVRIICFERFGYDLKFKPELIKKRNRKAARIAFEQSFEKQNQYRLMSHNRK